MLPEKCFTLPKTNKSLSASLLVDYEGLSTTVGIYVLNKHFVKDAEKVQNTKTHLCRDVWQIANHVIQNNDPAVW